MKTLKQKRIFTHNVRSEALEVMFLSDTRLRAVTAATLCMWLSGDLLKLQAHLYNDAF